MDKLEKVKTEYALFEEEKSINASSESVYALLEHCHYEMVYSVKTATKAIKQNSFDYKLEKAKSVVGQIFGYDISCDWILEDSEYLAKQISLAKGFDNYFVRLCEQLDDENYLEVSRLTQFTLDKYLDNYSYLESLRNAVNLSSSGITYYGKGDSDYEEFATFFEEEFNKEILKADRSEKVKFKNEQ